MSENAASSNENEILEIPARVNVAKRFAIVFFGRPVVIIGTIIILAFIISAIIPGWIAPYNPAKQDLSHMLESPSRDHLLGTDAIGRDTLSRLIFGSRTAIMIGVVALGIAAIIGIILGVTAGYFGGIVYAIIMRFIDALMSFPMILLCLTIAALLGGGMLNIMIGVGVGMMPSYARVMCSQAISVREIDYVLAARSVGGSRLHIIVSHVIPNCFPVMIVLMTMMIGMTILAEAG